HQATGVVFLIYLRFHFCPTSMGTKIIVISFWPRIGSMKYLLDFGHSIGFISHLSDVCESIDQPRGLIQGQVNIIDKISPPSGSTMFPTGQLSPYASVKRICQSDTTLSPPRCHGVLPCSHQHFFGLL